MTVPQITYAVMNKLQNAEEKHPFWPKDIIHAVAIMAEESGEVIKAAIQNKYENGAFSEIEKELIQTAAMCFRCLKNLK